MPNEDPQFDHLPPALVDALRELDGPAVLPDAQRDADVLSGARQHLAEQNKPRRSRLRLFITGTAGGAVAAAAMVGIVVLLGEPNQDAEPQAPAFVSIAPALPGDINVSGSVDILDAYALAKQIEQGQVNRTLDLNADGQVDQQDVDWIANQAVALNLGEQG